MSERTLNHKALVSSSTGRRGIREIMRRIAAQPLAAAILFAPLGCSTDLPPPTTEEAIEIAARVADDNNGCAEVLRDTGNISSTSPYGIEKYVRVELVDGKVIISDTTSTGIYGHTVIEASVGGGVFSKRDGDGDPIRNGSDMLEIVSDSTLPPSNTSPLYETFECDVNPDHVQAAARG